MKMWMNIRAGIRAFLLDNEYDKTRPIVRFAFLSMVGSYGLFACCGGLLVSLGWVWALSRKDRRLPVSPLHMEATSKVYSARALLRLYLLTFIACSLLMIPMVSVNPNSALFSIAAGIAIVGVPAVPMVLDGRMTRSYRKTYQALAEQAGLEPLPKPKLMSVQDKRELARRDAGLLGGFVITLALWSILVSVGLKLTFGGYTWQITKAMGGMPQAEMRYVKDLVDGKVKVPQKYIDEIKREEARYNVQRSTSNAQRSRRNGEIR